MCQRVSTAARHFFWTGTFTQFTRFLHDFTRFYVIFAQFYMIFTQFYAIFAIFTQFFARHKFSAARHLKLFCTPVCTENITFTDWCCGRSGSWWGWWERGASSELLDDNHHHGHLQQLHSHQHLCIAPLHLWWIYLCHMWKITWKLNHLNVVQAWKFSKICQSCRNYRKFYFYLSVGNTIENQYYIGDNLIDILTLSDRSH